MSFLNSINEISIIKFRLLYKMYLYNKMNLYCKTYSNNNMLQKKFIKAQGTLYKTYNYR